LNSFGNRRPGAARHNPHRAIAASAQNVLALANEMKHI
jgi:hypothetical protein